MFTLTLVLTSLMASNKIRPWLPTELTTIKQSVRRILLSSRQTSSFTIYARRELINGKKCLKTTVTSSHWATSRNEIRQLSTIHFKAISQNGATYIKGLKGLEKESSGRAILTKLLDIPLSCGFSESVRVECHSHRSSWLVVCQFGYPLRAEAVSIQKTSGLARWVPHN